MPTVWVTIWRGGDASNQTLWLNDQLLDDWQDAPEDPSHVRRGKYVMRELATNKTYQLRHRAGLPGSVFWCGVMRQGGTTLLDLRYTLPPAVNNTEPFKL
jgi:hypothetical protein